MPEDCQSKLYPTISPINNLRVLAGCLMKEKVALLPDKHFVVTYEDGPGFGDVVEVSVE